MKHQSPEELRQAAAIVAANPVTPLTRRERITRWADLLDRYSGPLEALYRIEYLPEDERRAYYGGDKTPLALAYHDPVLRADGLAGPRLGDALDYFEMTDEDAHRLLCDCHYMGTMTGRNLAARLRRHVSGGGLLAWAGSLFSWHPT